MNTFTARRVFATPQPALRVALRASPTIAAPRCQSRAQSSSSNSNTAMPVAHTDFWRSMVPKPFRKSERLPDDPAIQRVKPKRSKEWNPATFYIVIFLLIGSMSINMISMRQKFEIFMRQTDTRIGLLKEVVERIQKGENVDVEQMLGTGNPKQEQEWADVLREIEKDEAIQAPRKERSRTKSGTKDTSKTASTSQPQQQAPGETEAASEGQAGTTTTQQSSGMASFF